MNKTADISRLEAAFRSVLGPSFDEEVRALVESESWHNDHLQPSEAFRLWVIRCVERGAPAEWVFEPIRVSERRLLAEALRIPRDELIGQSPARVATRMLESCNIPVPLVWGHKAERDAWAHVEELVNIGEDQRASVILRQLAERLLRKVLHYHCATCHGNAFLDILSAPGSLRLPSRLERVRALEPQLRADSLVRAWSEDGWADLGFLTLALRKLAARVEASRPATRSSIFSQQDQKAFEDMAKALQAYTHDRPSTLETRQTTLGSSLSLVTKTVGTMLDTGSIPEEMFVLEAGNASYGYVFRGLSDSGQKRAFITQIQPPDCGTRVLVTATTQCDYAQASWAPSPWPVDWRTILFATA